MGMSAIHVERLRVPTGEVWCASFFGDDLGGPLAWGATPEAAAEALIERASSQGVVGFEAGHAMPVREIAEPIPVAEATESEWGAWEALS